MKTKPKIALIGCGNVLPTSVYSLLNGPVTVEVVLIGECSSSLLSAVNALITETPVRTDSTIRLGHKSDLSDSSICVLSSGRALTSSDSVEQQLGGTIDILRENGKILNESGFGGLVIVTTFPAEIMAQAVMETSGLDPRSIIGIGPSAQASYPREHTRLLPLATWCTAAGCAVEYIDSCHPDCPYFEGMLERFHRYQKSSDMAPATMAACVMRVCEAILTDEKAVLPVAAMMNGEHAIVGTFSTVPCVIGKNGIERVLELPLTEIEQRNLLDTARENGRLYYRMTKRAAAVGGSPSV